MDVKFGIIGLGNIAARFACALQEVNGVTLYAAAARDFNRARDFAGTYGASKAYGSYTELMDDKEVDIIYIALPHNFHFETVRQCLMRDKAVLCEKPMTVNEAEAVALHSLAKQRGILLAEAMWNRMLPAHLTARRWLQEGRIGSLRVIQADFSRYANVPDEHRLKNPALAGGSMWDIGIYPIHFAVSMAGSQPRHISSMMVPASTGVDETSTITILFENGIIANTSSSFGATTPCEAILAGTEGYLRLPVFYKATRCELYDHDQHLIDTFEEPCENGFVYEAAHMRDLFRDGKTESPLIPMSDTILSGQIFDTARRQWASQQK